MTAEEPRAMQHEFRNCTACGRRYEVSWPFGAPDRDDGFCGPCSPEFNWEEDDA